MNRLLSNTVFITLILFCSAAFAQPPKSMVEKKEHVEQLKISFLTQKLNLTRQEAQKFWPVYNEHHDALDALRKERKDEYKTYRERFEELSEKELTELVDKQIIYRQRELDLLKKYHAEYKSVLPVKKVAILYRAEEEFKREVLKEVQSRNPSHH